MRFFHANFLLASIVCSSLQVFAQPESSASKTKLGRPRTSSSEIFKSRSVGHLVTPNTQTLKENEVSLGTLYVGVGLTDQLMVSTSPFVFAQFDMANVQLRWAREIQSQRRVGVDFAYFKSVGETAEVDKNWEKYCGLFAEDCKGTKHPFGYASFKMEAVSLKLSASEMLRKWYRASVSAGYYYYLDDERPFSLRMDPQNNDRYAVSLTALSEFRVSEANYLNFEAGFWGLNYTYPYYHVGMTYNYQADFFLVGLGVSHTFSPQFPRERSRWFAAYDSTSSTHPEVQVQCFF